MHNHYLKEAPMRVPSRRRLPVLAPTVVAGLALVTLTACGSSTGSGSESSAASSQPAAAPSGAPSGAPSDMQGQFAKIQACLSAAGITNPAPSGGAPSGGFPSGAPTGAPTGAPPSGGSFSPPAGGGQPGLSDPKVKAALEACGISLPGGGNRPSGAPTPAST
jgi:hypothetical protein